MVIYGITVLTFVLILILLSQLAAFLSRRQNKVQKRIKQVLGGSPLPAKGEETPQQRRMFRHALPIKLSKNITESESIQNLQSRLTKAGVPLRVEEYLWITLAAGISGFILGMLVFHQPLLALVTSGLGFLLPGAWINQMHRRRMTKIEDQLLDAATMMANALRAGHSIMQAFELLSRELPEPLSLEILRVVREVRVGISLEEALNNLVGRIESRELEMLVAGILINREVGGNLAEILDRVAQTLNSRVKMKGRIRVLTAQGVISTWVVTLVPLFLAFFVFVMRPDIGGIMLEEPVGVMMLAIGMVMLVTGVYLVRKVVSIDV